MSALKGVLIFTALLVICAAGGTALALGLGWALGPIEWRGTVLGSIMTASLMLTTDPLGATKRRANKEP
jgi:hypothetical protein